MAIKMNVSYLMDSGQWSGWIVRNLGRAWKPAAGGLGQRQVDRCLRTHRKCEATYPTRALIKVAAAEKAPESQVGKTVPLGGTMSLFVQPPCSWPDGLPRPEVMRAGLYSDKATWISTLQDQFGSSRC